MFPTSSIAAHRTHTNRLLLVIQRHLTPINLARRLRLLWARMQPFLFAILGYFIDDVAQTIVNLVIHGVFVQVLVVNVQIRR